MDLSSDFLHFGASDFLLKIRLKSATKSSFFRSGVEIAILELQFPTPLCVVLLCFATQSLQIAL